MTFQKRESNNNFASLPKFPDTVFKILQTAKPSKEEQQEHGWNPQDRSPNIQVERTDHTTLTRQPVAGSTDSVRGKRGYSQGVNIWEVVWPTSHRGSHAVIGVATKEPDLHVRDYCSLVGSSQYSWGWNIVDTLLHHNTGFMNEHNLATTNPLSRCLIAYPDTEYLRNSQIHTEYKIPESFLMILDMDKGTLAFSVDGVYLGVAFHGLKGHTLHPIISTVWGNARIQLRYQGGTVQPASLAAICRLVITAKTGDDFKKIYSLPLPNRLKEYLQYRL